eukprot:6288213-Amphidinium_carterae.1
MACLSPPGPTGNISGKVNFITCNFLSYAVFSASIVFPASVLAHLQRYYSNATTPTLLLQHRIVTMTHVSRAPNIQTMYTILSHVNIRY